MNSQVQNPALRFLLGYQPSTNWSLHQLMEDYGDYLLNEAGAYGFPVNLEQVFNHFDLSVYRRRLEGQRGLVTPKLHIVCNASDRDSVQLFSKSHEMMELLFLALKEHDPIWLDGHLLDELFNKKESLCEYGAAALLMPMSLFRPLVEQSGMSMKCAIEIATASGISLIATIRRMLDTGSRQCILVIWKYAHAPNEFVPSTVGQLPLWGSPTSMDPPKKLRVDRVFTPCSMQEFIKKHKSVEMDTAVGAAFQAASGTISKGYDYLEIASSSGRYLTESIPAAYDGQPRVMSLIYFDDRLDQDPPQKH